MPALWKHDAGVVRQLAAHASHNFHVPDNFCNSIVHYFYSTSPENKERLLIVFKLFGKEQVVSES